VTIYLPQVPELPVAMLACARLGAVHSVVFAGFSAEALAQRLADSASRVLVTASGVSRGDKVVRLKEIADAACALAERDRGHPGVARVLVLEKSAVPREQTDMAAARDAWWRDEVPARPDYCPPVWVDAQHPLFLLYTSGSTGAPKGVVHATGGYMVGAGVSARAVFDLRPGDVFWCTADCGWITGHTYLTYGPLLCGASNVLFGSTPAHPDPGRCWRVVERHRVRVFYTSPTLVRALLQHGDAWPAKHDLSSLRLLATAGEPIGEAAWRWLHDVVGGGRCPVLDTWWQTETGTAMITPLPHAWPTKPGCATLPFFGVEPVLLDAATGRELPAARGRPAEGLLAIRRSWPGMARTIRGDHRRWEEAYFSSPPGLYLTGDAARRDADGFYWITGRVDDVINVSGHRLSTGEVESALTSHPLVAEAAVVGVPHAVKGEAVYAFVALVDGAPWPPPGRLKRELGEAVRAGIGAFAAADVVHWVPPAAAGGGLPKTRSGKILRRLLRQIATGGRDFGDVSTLADPSVVDQLVAMRGK
jgi:acetyl-CoA synthetase